MSIKENEIVSETTPLSSTNKICPRYEQAIQLLGKRWTGLLLDRLLSGPKRFTELTSNVEGLSEKVLNTRLRELEVKGIIERVVYPQIPVRVEYQLTEKGRALRPAVEAIHQWADQWATLPEKHNDDGGSSLVRRAGEWRGLLLAV